MNKNLTTEQDTSLVLNKSKSTLSITSRILSGKSSLTTEVAEEWIQRLWQWADENGLPELTEIAYSIYEVSKNLEVVILDKFILEHNIDLANDQMALNRIYSVIKSNINNITNSMDFDISLPFLTFDNHNNPIHFSMSFSKEYIEKIIKLNLLKENIIYGIPRNKKGLLALESLNLESFSFKLIPMELYNLTNLTELNLRGNELCTAGGNNSFNFLKGIKNFKNLNKLNITHSSISELSEDIGSLTRLTHLTLSDNQFMGKLPNKIINLKNLKEFDVRNSYKLKFTKEQKEWIEELKTNGCKVEIDANIVVKSNTEKKTTEVKIFGNISDDQNTVIEFEDNIDAWLDKDTGLMWEVKTRENIKHQYAWSKEYIDNYNYPGHLADDVKDAFSYAKNLNAQRYAGFSDWRVPSIEELKTILTKEKINYYIQFPLSKNTYELYWSSTISYTTRSALIVNFSVGNQYPSNKTDYKYVRCVRAEQ